MSPTAVGAPDGAPAPDVTLPVPIDAKSVDPLCSSNAPAPVDTSTSSAPTGAVSPARGGASSPGLSVGAGAPGAIGAGEIRCNPPRGFKSIEVDFTNAPAFSKCFFIAEAKYNALPKGHALTAQLTFKGSDRLGYTITMFKLQ